MLIVALQNGSRDGHHLREESGPAGNVARVPQSTDIGYRVPGDDTLPQHDRQWRGNYRNRREQTVRLDCFCSATQVLTFEADQILPAVNWAMFHQYPLPTRGVQSMVRSVILVQVGDRLIIVRIVIVIDILFGSAVAKPCRASNAADLEVRERRRGFVGCGQGREEPFVLPDLVRVKRTVLDRPDVLGQRLAEPGSMVRVRSNRAPPPPTDFQLHPASIAIALTIVDLYPFVIVIRAARGDVVVGLG